MYANSEFRFGSAEFADERDLARAGLFGSGAASVLLGFHGHRPLRIGGQGGIVTVAGARSGKLRDVLGYTVCGSTPGNLVVLDPKGELAAVSQDQTALGKHCVTWNPCGLHGLPAHRINPVSYIRADSRTLVSDIKVFVQNVLPLTGSAHAEYFERRGQEYAEALALTLIERDGALTLPALYEVINLLVRPSEAWLSFAFDMHESRFPLVRRVEEEIAENHRSESNGFRGIVGEIFKAFQALSDPLLMASVSPPYDFSFEQLVEGHERFNVYLMPPVEFIGAWSAVIKAMFVAARITKARAPQAPGQLWILDEAGNLGAFPSIVEMFTYGAGQNIRPWAVFQSVDQMNKLGPGARNIILSSAATRQFFGVRDLETARMVSAMCGVQTLAYDDTQAQNRAELARRQAMLAVLQGSDPVEAAIRHAHHKAAAEMPSKQARDLRTPDEILNMPIDRQLIFSDAVPKPIYAERRPYYEQRFMAGRFHPNPYFLQASDRVRVRTSYGHAWRWVIREPVPERFAHLIQYRDGYWSHVEGAP
jgi:type IV secretion system protein VirD4